MENSGSESSKGKKRWREEETAAESSNLDEILSLEESFSFSDTIVALRIMRAQFPRIDKASIQPFVLWSQLYSSVMDRTQVDTDLELTLLSLGGKVKDEHITLLINASLLSRQLIDPNMYWFTIPNVGSVLKGISLERKEVLSLLNRRRYKEMMMASLEKQRLQLSPLDMRFHLRDLIGSVRLKTVQTPTGLVVQVSKD